jgi:hypothetical protein
MAYESYMTIVFDFGTKAVIVSFPDNVVTLPGPIADRKTGVAAGEAHCKSLGWKD